MKSHLHFHSSYNSSFSYFIFQTKSRCKSSVSKPPSAITRVVDLEGNQRQKVVEVVAAVVFIIMRRKSLWFDLYHGWFSNRATSIFGIIVGFSFMWSHTIKSVNFVFCFYNMKMKMYWFISRVVSVTGQSQSFGMIYC